MMLAEWLRVTSGPVETVQDPSLHETAPIYIDEVDVAAAIKHP